MGRRPSAGLEKALQFDDKSSESSDLDLPGLPGDSELSSQASSEDGPPPAPPPIKYHFDERPDVEAAWMKETQEIYDLLVETIRIRKEPADGGSSSLAARTGGG